ncbi:MAG: C45 family peptidase [Pseudomonadota bacterium]
MSARSFARLELSGDASERGYQHGEALKHSIAETVDYYREIFRLSEDSVKKHARYFSDLIAGFKADYFVEIEAIARAADIPTYWVVAINARTEMLSLLKTEPQECTTLCLPEQQWLMQNWDWGKPLESLTHIIRIEQSNGTIIETVCEPGMLGKIGLNNHGLGVCLNILTINRPLSGLPVHILLRSVLDCENTHQVRELVTRYGAGKASNLMVCDHRGDAFNIEFADERQFLFESAVTPLIHTNHYLGEQINPPGELEFKSSYTRYHRASEILDSMLTDDQDPELIGRTLLSDTATNPLPIFRRYIPEATVGLLGTICTVLMDLKQRTLWVRKGSVAENPFQQYRAG